MNPQPTPEQQEDFEDVRLFNAMTAFFTLSKRPWLFGLASLLLTMLSSTWFVMCFTARERAWWNSIYWFLLFYATAAILALRGIRSVMGIVALLFAIVPLALLGIFLFVLRHFFATRRLACDTAATNQLNPDRSPKRSR